MFSRLSVFRERWTISAFSILSVFFIPHQHQNPVRGTAAPPPPHIQPLLQPLLPYTQVVKTSTASNNNLIKTLDHWI
jgi:hypothetical protein